MTQNFPKPPGRETTKCDEKLPVYIPRLVLSTPSAFAELDKGAIVKANAIDESGVAVASQSTMDISAAAHPSGSDISRIFGNAQRSSRKTGGTSVQIPPRIDAQDTYQYS